MHRIILAAAVLLAGCQNLVGPFQRPRDRVDDPLLSISEQQTRGRDRLAVPEESATVAPRTLIERPGPHGR